MNTTNIVTPMDKASPITSFVITLGQLLLQQKVKDWLDMLEVARFCKDHNIHVDGKVPVSDALEAALRLFFKDSAEFYGPDVNVDGYERPRGWDRPFMIKAYPYSPKQQSLSAHLAALDSGALLTACSD